MTEFFMRWAAVVMIAALLGACKKKDAEADSGSAPAAAAPSAATAAPGKDILPGASSVRSSLAKKDYDNAVGGLLALKGAATQSPLTEEYMKLYDEVKGALLDAGNDPKAANALMTLRAASAGR